MSIKKFSKFDDYMNKASNIFMLLADKNRLSVFSILTYGEFTVSSIFKCLQLRQNLISHHLKVLRNNQLVKSRRKGREIFYSLNLDKIREFDQSLEKILRPLK